MIFGSRKREKLRFSRQDRTSKFVPLDGVRSYGASSAALREKCSSSGSGPLTAIAAAAGPCSLSASTARMGSLRTNGGMCDVRPHLSGPKAKECAKICLFHL